MAIATLTRLGSRDPAALEEVGALAGQVAAQLAVTPGFLGGRLMLDGPTAWTLSAFADAGSLRAFGQAHAAVAAQGPRLADSLLLTSWTTDDDDVPSWDDARACWPYGEGPGDGLAGDLPAAQTGASTSATTSAVPV